MREKKNHVERRGNCIDLEDNEQQRGEISTSFFSLCLYIPVNFNQLAPLTWSIFPNLQFFKILKLISELSCKPSNT